MPFPRRVRELARAWRVVCATGHQVPRRDVEFAVSKRFGLYTCLHAGCPYGLHLYPVAGGAVLVTDCLASEALALMQQQRTATEIMDTLERLAKGEAGEAA